MEFEPTSHWCGSCFKKKNVMAISISRDGKHWETINLCIKCRKELRKGIKPKQVEV